jgi:hypothetical protein
MYIFVTNDHNLSINFFFVLFKWVTNVDERKKMGWFIDLSIDALIYSF